MKHNFHTNSTRGNMNDEPSLKISTLFAGKNICFKKKRQGPDKVDS